jgi:D-alanyl-lipoteichoic acid acyltransferase DltB (MBOAT superfamily)
VDKAFANPAALTTWELWLAMFLYSLFLYCDFAGYSDMARGASRLLGIEIIRNFEQPYLAVSIADFWRRWHISLSNWLRDYLYIPLGGGRVSSPKVYRNLILTMLLCGLWHGAAWHFVAWGGVHALALCLHRAWRQARPAIGGAGGALLKPLGQAGAWALTFLVVALGWVLFRAPDMATAWAYLEGLFIPRGGIQPALLTTPALATGLVLLLDLPQRLTGTHTAMLRMPRPLQAAIMLGFLVWLALAPSPPAQRAFVYLAF